MTRIHRRQLSELVSARAGVSRTAARELIAHVFDAISEELAKGNSVTVSGFGTWRMKVSAPRRCRSPRGDGEVAVPPRTRVAFKAGAALRRTAESSVEPEVFFGRGIGRESELGGIFARLFGLDPESLDQEEVRHRIRDVLANSADEEAAEFFAALQEYGASLAGGANAWPDELADLAGLPRAVGEPAK